MEFSETIMGDSENMAKFNKSFGDFFQVNYKSGLSKLEFEDKELADQIMDLSEREMNSLYASESWFDVSAKLNSYVDDAEFSHQLTWKERGFKTFFDFLTKKLPDPLKALPVDEKILFNKEVTNINWNVSEAIAKCADGSEYQADHVIVTVSLGFLKQNYKTLFTPQLPEKKVNAIENTGFGTLGKFFLEFEEPFWPTDIKNWTAYLMLWTKEDKYNITGSEREWLTNIIGFLRVDAQPNVISGLVAGKHLKRFEEISDAQLIDDCMWLLQKSLGRVLPRPINMKRSKWMTNKYFLGSYSFASMDTQAHNVLLAKDLAETMYGDSNKPLLLIAGEATVEFHSGYVHGAVESGLRAAAELLRYYTSH
ncbi:Peroxisomal N(1)-acetyl-spermine/spermidine oxidase [Pseudolycoriella hygida]|uniref:Peroxisomal N(1)-acetyl-spermine/spermidine oxidase n=1 Tax=Pseudolycoriella hygida TaxID=35572 RepID=A0A9Q0RW13_9DIPT|nr:Peroxisomal N(1)-acetyl-spermine/spermidine oxidase [Pseudolycoriella hygida]